MVVACSCFWFPLLIYFCVITMLVSLHFRGAGRRSLGHSVLRTGGDIDGLKAPVNGGVREVVDIRVRRGLAGLAGDLVGIGFRDEPFHAQLATARDDRKVVVVFTGLSGDVERADGSSFIDRSGFDGALNGVVPLLGVAIFIFESFLAQERPSGTIASKDLGDDGGWLAAGIAIQVPLS